MDKKLKANEALLESKVLNIVSLLPIHAPLFAIPQAALKFVHNIVYIDVAEP